MGIKFPTPWKTLIIKFPPPRDGKGVKCPGYARGGHVEASIWPIHYACAFNQSELGKYFEWIFNYFYYYWGHSWNVSAVCNNLVYALSVININRVCRRALFREHWFTVCKANCFFSLFSWLSLQRRGNWSWTRANVTTSKNKQLHI